ncbi:hypothetical protein O0I10_011786 [Lichtheimia ornata]|uniref:Uncharacterized protein n=1 Tax=Lichtheimia ornata TaxID=688661 RepID=A0AAD7XTS9_9FUNG|nr:uncharacterized protein O0I10_011786 [Lichtheimia ornata]KAJ8652581.1 hypothetical protein O0I10_011786 [Lichtheimia ornata]
MTSKGLDALLKFLLTSDKLQQVRNQARGRRYRMAHGTKGG